MIEFSNNSILIDKKEIELPIRINEILEFKKKIIVKLGFSAREDCDFKGEWTSEIDEKWNLLNSNFKETTLYCYDFTGNLV